MLFSVATLFFFAFSLLLFFFLFLFIFSSLFLFHFDQSNAGTVLNNSHFIASSTTTLNNIHFIVSSIATVSKCRVAHRHHLQQQHCRVESSRITTTLALAILCRTVTQTPLPYHHTSINFLPSYKSYFDRYLFI